MWSISQIPVDWWNMLRSFGDPLVSQYAIVIIVDIVVITASFYIIATGVTGQMVLYRLRSLNKIKYAKLPLTFVMI